MNKISLHYFVMSLDKGLSWKDKSDAIVERAKELIERYNLFSTSRECGLVYKRQTMFYYLYHNTALSLVKIGEMFNKDHATVLYGQRQFMNAKLYRDQKFLREIQHFEDEVVNSFEAKRFMERTKKK